MTFALYTRPPPLAEVVAKIIIMAEQDLTIANKKEWAKMLYLGGQLTQKEIAAKVGTSEVSISKWVNEGKWDALKKTLQTTKEEQLKNLYQLLEMLNKQAKDSLEDDDPDTNPDADKIIKITKAINYLEKDSGGMGQVYLTLMDFMSFVQRESLEHAQIINNYADGYVKERLNKF